MPVGHHPGRAGVPTPHPPTTLKERMWDLEAGRGPWITPSPCGLPFYLTICISLLLPRCTENHNFQPFALKWGHEILPMTCEQRRASPQSPLAISSPTIKAIVEMVEPQERWKQNPCVRTHRVAKELAQLGLDLHAKPTTFWSLLVTLAWLRLS